MTALCGARDLTPTGVIDGCWVQVEAGAITAVGPGTPPPGDTVDLGGAWLLPGYIDLHMHGGGGHDATASPADLAAAVAFHRAHGTTRTLVSLVTAPLDALAEQLGWIADRVAAGPTPQGPRRRRPPRGTIPVARPLPCAKHRILAATRPRRVR